MMPDKGNSNHEKSESCCDNGGVSATVKLALSTGSPEHPCVEISSLGDLIQEPAKDDTSCKPFILADKPCGFQDTQAPKPPAQGIASTEAIGSPVSRKTHVEGEPSDILKPIEFTGLNMSQKSNPVEVDAVPSTASFQCGSSASDLPAQELLKEPTPPIHVDFRESNSNIGELNTVDTLKMRMETKDSRESDSKSDNGLDFGIKGSAKVATELEQNVQDFKEALCSYSEEISYKDEQSDSRPDTVNEKQIHGRDAEQNLSGGISSQKGEEHMMSSNNVTANPENCIQCRMLSMEAENAEDVPCNCEKGMLDFDLNDICPMEMDCPNTSIAAPVSSQAAVQVPLVVSPGLDSAYPRGTLDGPVLRSNVLDSDRNTVEGCLDGVAGAVLTNQIADSSGLLSSESSLEVTSKRVRLNVDLNLVVTSRRAERFNVDLNLEATSKGEKIFNVDLNCRADNDDAPTSHMMERESFHNYQDDQYSSSLVPFPSLLKQPFVSKIDLNENISWLTDQIPASSVLSGESSTEVTSRIAEGLDYDLNLEVTSRRVERFNVDLNYPVGNDDAHSSLAPFLSPFKRLFKHKIDLNEKIAFLNQLTDSWQSSYPGMSDCGGFEQHDSSFKLFGTRLEFDKKCFVSSPSNKPFHMSMKGGGPPPAGFDLNSNLMMVDGGASELRTGQSQLKESMWSTPQFLRLGRELKRKQPDGSW